MTIDEAKGLFSETCVWFDPTETRRPQVRGSINEIPFSDLEDMTREPEDDAPPDADNWRDLAKTHAAAALTLHTSLGLAIDALKLAVTAAKAGIVPDAAPLETALGLSLLTVKQHVYW